MTQRVDRRGRRLLVRWSADRQWRKAIAPSSPSRFGGSIPCLCSTKSSAQSSSATLNLPWLQWVAIQRSSGPPSHDRLLVRLVECSAQFDVSAGRIRPAGRDGDRLFGEAPTARAGGNRTLAIASRATLCIRVRKSTSGRQRRTHRLRQPRTVPAHHVEMRKAVSWNGSVDDHVALNGVPEFNDGSSRGTL
jgi:hypothetical protein